MHTYFEYIDHVVLALCFVFTLINTIRMVRQATISVRKVPAYFVVFGATAIATFMGFGHLFEISYHAVERAIAGTFVYDFRFYSLMLMGMVILMLSVRMLGSIRELFLGNPDGRREVIKAALLIVAVSAPTGTFTPIGYMPGMGCIITLIALPFVIRRPAAVRQLNDDEAEAIPVYR